MSLRTDIVFTESYVLGLNIEPYLVRITADFVLSPSHPEYVSPGVHEQECYRRGEVRIRGFRNLTWEATGFMPSHDSTGEFDFGNLDELEAVEDTWRIVGDWGVLIVEGGSLHIELFDARPPENTAK